MAYWYNPKNGEVKEPERIKGKSWKEFIPPTNGYGNDWVLIVDDAAANFFPPGKI